MATFEAQISAQVTRGAKDDIGSVLAEDRKLSLGVYEADVIREALALGMARLAKIGPERRAELYARRRRDLGT